MDATRATRRYKPQLQELADHDANDNPRQEPAGDVRHGEAFYSDHELFASSAQGAVANTPHARAAPSTNPSGAWPAARARVRMEDGQLIDEEVYEDFQRMDAQEIQERFKPPYAPTLETHEVQTMLDWEKRRIEQRQRLRHGKFQQFIRNVAGFLHMQPDRLLGSPVGEGSFRGAGASPYGQSTIPQNALQTILAPPQLGGVIPLGPLDVSSLPVPPPGPTPPAQVKGKSDEADVPFLASDVVPTQEGARSLTPQELAQIQEHENAQRLYTAKSWMETAPVMGLQDLAPGLAGHADMAYTLVTQRVASMRDVPNAEALIHTDVVQVQTLFARLTAWLMSETNFFEPTRQTYDANAARIRQHVHFVLRALGHYTWDPHRRDFNGLDEVSGMFQESGCFPRTASGTRRPRYLL